MVEGLGCDAGAGEPAQGLPLVPQSDARGLLLEVEAAVVAGLLEHDPSSVPLGRVDAPCVGAVEQADLRDLQMLVLRARGLPAGHEGRWQAGRRVLLDAAPVLDHCAVDPHARTRRTGGVEQPFGLERPVAEAHRRPGQVRLALDR